MHDILVSNSSIYLIVKITVLILVLCIWLATTAAPVY
jgi:hypothetical protein